MREYYRIQLRDGSWGRIYPKELGARLLLTVYKGLRNFFISMAILLALLIMVGV